MAYLNDSLARLLEQVILFVPKLVIGVVVLVISLYLASVARRLVDSGARRRAIDPELAVLFSRLAYWGIAIVGVALALQQVDFNVGAFVAGLGIIGFTIGFALQDIAKNFVAGVLLLLQQPFDIGETIEVKGFLGKVEAISLRATELRTLDGVLAYIPNSDVYTNPLQNYSRAPRRRLELNVGVAYGTDLEHVTSTALAAIAGVPGVVTDDPAPTAVFDRFGDSAMEFRLFYWFDTAAAGYFQVQDAATKAIDRAFQEAGIEVPYPTHSVLLHNAPAAQ